MSATILVVDDLESNIRVLEAKLNSEYYNVLTANSAEKAFEILENNKVDLILLDVMMPNIDGIVACKKIKENPETSYIPVVMVTALADIEYRIKGLEAGADEFLTKPINDLSLFVRVKSLTRIKSLLDELQLRNETNEELGIDRIAITDDFTKSNIMIFDDDIVQAKNSANILKDIVNEVRIFTSYEEFDQCLKTYSPDLVMLSCHIDNVDSLRVCSTLRAKEYLKHMSIVLLAEEDRVDIVIKGMEIGANDYFITPIDSNELLARIKTQLRRKIYIDDLRNDIEQNFNLSIKDSLANIFNRRYFDNHIKLIIARCKKLDKNLFLIMIDIDGFKLINDNYGHQAGDEVIILVADILKNNLRVTDLLARYGGDEFIIAIPEIKLEYAMGLIERIRVAIQNLEFTSKYTNKSIKLTLSIGIVEYINQTIEELINQADKALYQSKIAGRNKISTYIESTESLQKYRFNN